MNVTEKRRAYWGAYALGAATMFAVTVFGQTILYPTTARAQVPDSGKQRNEMIDELKTANRTLVEIRDVLRAMQDQEAGKDAKAAKRP